MTLLLALTIVASCTTGDPVVEHTRALEERHERLDLVPPVEMPDNGSPEEEPEGSVAARLLFEAGSVELTPRARARLDELAGTLGNGNLRIRMELRGHTDGTGHDDENYRIGLARAESVRRYLHRNAGIPLDRIAIVSRGAAAPVADDATPAGRALNRRVEVAILDQE